MRNVKSNLVDTYVLITTTITDCKIMPPLVLIFAPLKSNLQLSINDFAVTKKIILIISLLNPRIVLEAHFSPLKKRFVFQVNHVQFFAFWKSGVSFILIAIYKKII